MQNWPLTITAILRHAWGANGDRTVTTATGQGGYRTGTYREIGEQAARLAHALRGFGITGDERVGTFMWNNAEHLVAYLAVPAMGAVLHTLNIRLSPEQIAYIANEAQDRVIVADASLVAQLAPVLPLLETVHTVIVAGDGDVSALKGVTVVRYDEVLAAQPAQFDWPDIDESSAAAMCYTSGTTGNPKGVVYSHRSSYLHALSTCTANALDVGTGDVVLPIVPMFHANAWGLPYAALMAGAHLVMVKPISTTALASRINWLRHDEREFILGPRGSYEIAGVRDRVKSQIDRSRALRRAVAYRAEDPNPAQGANVAETVAAASERQIERWRAFLKAREAATANAKASAVRPMDSILRNRARAASGFIQGN